MLEFILRSGRGLAVAPDTSRVHASVAVTLIDDEAEELELDDYEHPSATASLHVGGAGVLLEYARGTHGEGLQPLSVARIERRGEHVYLFGVCHLSGKCKSFRGDRILSLVDPGTGEAYQDVIEWHDSGQFTDLGMLRRFRDDLLLLSYLARADGHVCSAELDQVEMHLDRIAIDEGEQCPSRAAIETMSCGLAPEWTSASLACANLRTEPQRALRLWRAIRHVVKADRLLHLAEQELVGEVKVGLGVS